MSGAIDYALYSERAVGRNSPSYVDVVNRPLRTIITISGLDPDSPTFPGFLQLPAGAGTNGQVLQYVSSLPAWHTLVAADISDLATATTGITKLGTVATGTWQATSIATTYTDAKIKTVTGTTNRLAIGGTSTDPIFNIDPAYVGQSSITTLGTIGTGVWQGTAVALGFTVAQLVSLTGTSNRLTVSGTASAPIVDIAAAYVGQNTITTLGTVSTGTWNGTAIANAFLASGIDVTKLTAGATLPANVTGSSLTSVGTISAGVWQGTSIGTGFTDAKIATVTGTLNRLTIGGTATAPTFDISSSYVGQASITTVGTITSGVWAGTTVSLAATATALATPRNINGVAFDGTAPITITATATNALTIGTHLSGTSYNGSGPVTIATDATPTNVISTIVARDGSGNFAAGTITAALTGNASTATALATARAINGVNFDGTAPITVTAAAGSLTGATLNATVTASSLTSLGTLGALAVTGTSTITGDIDQAGELNVTRDGATVTVNAATSTAAAYVGMGNGTARLFVGVESSAGGGIFPGTAAYSAVVGHAIARSLHLVTNNVVALTIDSSQNTTHAGFVNAASYKVGGVAGASGTGTVLTALTVVNGIVTAITIS